MFFASHDQARTKKQFQWVDLVSGPNTKSNSRLQCRIFPSARKRNSEVSFPPMLGSSSSCLLCLDFFSWFRLLFFSVFSSVAQGFFFFGFHSCFSNDHIRRTNRLLESEYWSRRQHVNPSALKSCWPVFLKCWVATQKRFHLALSLDGRW